MCSSLNEPGRRRTIDDAHVTLRLPITIVGGGLAGLALGIALRQRDVPVTICEAGRYPRHRVCGEFICGSGLEVLRELGLHQKFIAAGAVEARSAAFHSARRSYPSKTLPCPALCLSRHVMDELLANVYRHLGGQLRERERVTTTDPRPGLVRATGRRIDVSQSKVKWIGLKAHARHALLVADLEMHFVPDGYVGLCRLGGGEVNVCGLFAVPGPLPQLAERWPEFLRGPAGSVLRSQLGKAEFVADSFCAVSGLDLRPASVMETRECCVGDALTMIPPVTGNGMSMAFESAAWAAESLAAYSRGDMAWNEARFAIGRRCAAGFGRRLHWASLVQQMLMDRRGREVVLALANRFDWLWRAIFNRTR